MLVNTLLNINNYGKNYQNKNLNKIQNQQKPVFSGGGYEGMVKKTAGYITKALEGTDGKLIGKEFNEFGKDFVEKFNKQTPEKNALELIKLKADNNMLDVDVAAVQINNAFKIEQKSLKEVIKECMQKRFLA